MQSQSSTREDYIRSIYLLDEHGEHVSVTIISSYLHVSKPGVTQMLRILSEEGLVHSPRYGRIKLSRQGKLLGERLTRKHRIIELFLSRTLKLSKSKVHPEANRLEHAISDEILKRIEHILGKPRRDPHGNSIPPPRRSATRTRGKSS